MLTKRIRHTLLLAAIAILTLAIAGCGSGNNNSSKNGKVTLKVASLLPEGNAYGGLDLTLYFPKGITVQLDPSTGEPLPSVVRLLGATNPALTFITVKYKAATDTASGSLRFQVFDTLGFSSNSNEYIELLLDVTPGFIPKTSDFEFSPFTVTDLAGNVTILPKPAASIEII